MKLAILTFVIMVALLIVIYIIDERKHRKMIATDIEEILKGRIKMTFEEVVEIIKEECGVENEDGFFTNERNLDAFFALYIIKNLKETYAPKIKMTFEQKDELMQFLGESDFGFENFWFCLGSGSNLYIEFTENELMRAWLHPELIEVLDD